MRLTRQAKAEILRLHAEGKGRKDISDTTGYSVSSVYMVTSGREWSDYYETERNTRYAKAYRARKRLRKGTAA